METESSHDDRAHCAYPARVRKAVSGLLLGFVLISIGFAIGKEAALSAVRRTKVAEVSTAPERAGGSLKVIVYYMHPTFRCVTCNTIERLSRQVVQEDFGEELRRGELEWRTVNIHEDEDLARRYDVSSSTVVVCRVRAGKEAAYRRLDDVWILVDNAAEFRRYLAEAIRAYLAAEERP